jgi:hypothetical protein
MAVHAVADDHAGEHVERRKNHWGWASFTTHDLKRCRIIADLIIRLQLVDAVPAAGRSRPSPRGLTSRFLLLQGSPAKPAMLARAA